jgi:radical SAM protein with 4Fe4S-binding SPASM domain
MKESNLTVSIDTNGILLSKKIRKMLLDNQVDSIFISLDALTNETYQRVRGKVDFQKIKNNVHTLLVERGKRKFPRIGVSFVSEPINHHEESQFIAYWSQYVDVVRTNKIFSSKRKIESDHYEIRQPCWSLYDTLMVHPNGEAALCCVDTHYQNPMGNVFHNGLLNVWNNIIFKQAREIHNRKEFSKIEICNQCDLWRNSKAVTKETENLIIASTDSHTFYNRKDKLNNIMTNRYVDRKLL